MKLRLSLIIFLLSFFSMHAIKKSKNVTTTTVAVPDKVSSTAICLRSRNVLKSPRTNSLKSDLPPRKKTELECIIEKAVKTSTVDKVLPEIAQFLNTKQPRRFSDVVVGSSRLARDLNKKYPEAQKIVDLLERYGEKKFAQEMSEEPKRAQDDGWAGNRWYFF